MTDYDVKAFGAVGDNATDDWPAFQAAIAAASPGDSVIVSPPPNRYLLSAFELSRPIAIKGSPGAYGGCGASKITLAPKVWGLSLLNAFQSADGDDAAGCALEGLDIQCTPSNDEVLSWPLGEPVTVEQLLLEPGAYHARFEVAVAGTLDPSIIPSIRDVAHVPDFTFLYAPGATLRVGRRFRGSNPASWCQDYRVVSLPGGASSLPAGPEPSWPGATGTYFADGLGVQWQVMGSDCYVACGTAILRHVAYGGIYATTLVTVRDVLVRGPQCRGWALYGSAPSLFGSNAVGSTFERVRTILQAGQRAVGCYTRGGDLRGCLMSRIWSAGTSTVVLGLWPITSTSPPSDPNEHGIVDESYDGLSWEGCFSEYHRGLDYWAASPNSRTFFRCETREGRVRLDGAATWSGPVPFYFRDGGQGRRISGLTGDGSASIAGYSGGPGLDSNAPHGIKFTTSNGAFVFWPVQESGSPTTTYGSTWMVAADGTLQGWMYGMFRAGHWSLLYGGAGKPTMSVSTRLSGDDGGLLTLHRGFYDGRDPLAAPYAFPSLVDYQDASIRGDRRIVGDRIYRADRVAPGAYAWDVVVTAGTVATAVVKPMGAIGS
jgi:hypothetical protein